jgi:hypothetical protein
MHRLVSLYKSFPVEERSFNQFVRTKSYCLTQYYTKLYILYCLYYLRLLEPLQKLMVVPSTADGFRAAFRTLRSLDGKEGEFAHLHTRRIAVCDSWLKTWAGVCLSACGRSANLLTYMTREPRSCDSYVAIRTPPRTTLPFLTSPCQWRESWKRLKYERSTNAAVCECR